MGESAPEALENLKLGPATVLFGEKRGKYPSGNSILVEGRDETVVIDPSLGMLPRRDLLPRIDRVLHSHCHEDHISGSHLFPDVPWHFHELDLPGIRSLDAMMAIYGFPEGVDRPFRKLVETQFHFFPRPDALSFGDGDVFDLGGPTVRVLHTPGHTRGHSCFLIEAPDSADSILYLGDIDLSSFGPYYGDAWSNLEDFERSIARVRGVEVRWYATFHHIGVLEREPFLERLARFEAVIADREERLLEYLVEPHTLDDIAGHRFVYRPGDAVGFAEPVERRSMSQHLERLLACGRVDEVAPGSYRRAELC